MAAEWHASVSYAIIRSHDKYCLFSVLRHSINQWCFIFDSTLGNTLLSNSNQNTIIFIQENWFENIATKWWPFCFGPIVLTLNVQGPCYLGLTRSISWLLMTWLLTSPGHQQQWYWLYRICWFLSYLRTCVISMWRNDTKCKYMFMFPLKNLARKELRS